MPFPCAGNCGRQVFNRGETCSNCLALRTRQGLRTPVIAPTIVGPTLAPGTLPGGAALQLKCRRSGQLNWIDVAHNSTLYVLKGTVVEFTASSTGGAPLLQPLINLETAAWGGTAAAVSVGKKKNVTFGTNSASNVLPSTLTVTFGGQTVQANVIVYTLNVRSTPADDFNGRSQADLGVDERVSLTFDTTPLNVSALNAGGLVWQFAGAAVNNRNTLGLVYAPGTQLPAAQTGLADFVAPCRTHQGGEQIQPSKEVTLRLAVVAGPSLGLGPELRFRIHKPAAHMTRVTGSNTMHYNQGFSAPSAGFLGQIFLTPKNVSFRTLRWREGAGTMESWGACAGDEGGTIHQSTVHQTAVHGTINGGDANTGCYVNQTDTVRSAANGYAVPQFASPSTPVGGKKWPINWEYTYADLATGNWTTDWIGMQTAHHVGTLYQNGRFTIFKGHIGCATGDCMKEPVSKDLSDTHNWP